MPKWGLTRGMVDAAPWRIDPRYELLEPAKVVTDPVHGDIYLNRLELLIVDSRPLQRLRRVQQLGMTSMVYPGATNARFAHSLGALRAAQDLLDIVFDQRHEPHAVPDLFTEWEEILDDEDEDELPRRLGEITVLARLGALLHDLGHVPFGHSVEDDLGILEAHDKNKARFDFLWAKLKADLETKLKSAEFKQLRTLTGGELFKSLKPLILSKQEDRKGEPIPAHTVIKYPFVADIVGNTICADLIDYLARDHLYSGLPMALGHRFLTTFFVTRSDRTRLEERMALNIDRDNRERTDVITELLKYLRYRYELTERVLVHHAKLAADAMVGKALELWFAELAADRAAELPGDGPTAAEGPEAPSGEPSKDLPQIEDADDDRPGVRAQKRVERRILAHGDDGLLEHLRDWVAERRIQPPASASEERLTAISELVEGLLRRDLFQLAGRSSTQQASAKAIYEKHGSADKRRELEEEAARFAGISEPWKIAIWLPPPDPRLKSAEVLVFDGSEVVEFSRSEQYTTKRGEDIYGAHGKLWGVSVYIHRSIEDEDVRRRALARLAQRMEVRFDREAERLGRNVLKWPDQLAVRKLAEEKPNQLLGREDELLDLAERQVARGPDDVDTFDALVAQYRQAARDLPSKS